jgi:hypothetical protein
LFQKWSNGLRLSVTIETDLETIRKRFSPQAPPIAARFRTVRTLREAGLPVQVAVAPVLPFSPAFPEKLARVVQRVCIDDYFLGDGSQGRRTEQLGMKNIYAELGLTEWYGKGTWKRAAEAFRRTFAPEQILISQEGFLP